MQLKNAKWDFSKDELVLSPNTVTNIPLLHIIPYSAKKVNVAGLNFISCPVIAKQRCSISCVICVNIRSNSNQDVILNKDVCLMFNKHQLIT